MTTALARNHYCQRKLFPKRKRNNRMHFGANQDTKKHSRLGRSHEQNDDSPIVPDDKRILQPPCAEK